MIYLFDDTSDLYISKYINTLEFTDVQRQTECHGRMLGKGE